MDKDSDAEAMTNACTERSCQVGCVHSDGVESTALVTGNFSVFSVYCVQHRGRNLLVLVGSLHSLRLQSSGGESCSRSFLYILVKPSLKNPSTRGRLR